MHHDDAISFYNLSDQGLCDGHNNQKVKLSDGHSDLLK